MIGRLQGTVISKKAPELLLDVHGVGYEVQAPMSTFYHLPELGEQTTLLTHLVVREDGHLLFGFASTQERALFRALIKVNGVGPKLALTILSSIEPQSFIQCVQLQDDAMLVKVPGVGKKTAQRLLIEMHDRCKDLFADSDGPPTTTAAASTGNANVREAMSALLALGYKEAVARRLLAQSQLEENMSVEQIIRLALKGSALEGA